MRYKLLCLVLLLEILLASAATVGATDLRGGVVGPDPHTQVQNPLVGIGVALFAVKQDGTFSLVRQTATGHDGKYYFNAINAGRYILQIGGTNYQLEVNPAQSQDIPIIVITPH
jgi:hypothetical protein